MPDNIKEAKIGSTIPLVKELDNEIDALDYFSKLSNFGKSKHSFFFRHENRSFGTSAPCIAISGKGPNFEIKALNETGKRILAFVKKDFGFCDKLTYNKDRIHGILTASKKAMGEDQRLRAKTHMDIISTVSGKFTFKNSLGIASGGVFGIFSPYFINGIPDLENGYVAYLADNMFLVDHSAKKTYFTANAFITDNRKEKAHADCIKILNSYEKLLSKKMPKNGKGKKKKFEMSIASKETLASSIRNIRRNISEGNLLFGSASSAASCNFSGNALELFAAYGKFTGNDSYYFSNDDGIIMGASTGTGVSIGPSGQIILDMVTSGQACSPKEPVDSDLGNKHEALLKTDEGELVKHMILADVARNELACISAKGSRFMERFFSDAGGRHNLAFRMKGNLREGLGSLQACACMMNFWNGITKQTAFDLSSPAVRQSEGFNSGSVLMAYPDGSIANCHISCLSLRKDKVAAAARSMVFHNTNEEHEAEKISQQAASALGMIKEAGGMK